MGSEKGGRFQSLGEEEEEEERERGREKSVPLFPLLSSFLLSLVTVPRFSVSARPGRKERKFHHLRYNAKLQTERKESVPPPPFSFPLLPDLLGRLFRGSGTRTVRIQVSVTRKKKDTGAICHKKGLPKYKIGCSRFEDGRTGEGAKEQRSLLSLDAIFPILSGPIPVSHTSEEYVDTDGAKMHFPFSFPALSDAGAGGSHSACVARA